MAVENTWESEWSRRMHFFLFNLNFALFTLNFDFYPTDPREGSKR